MHGLHDLSCTSTRGVLTPHGRCHEVILAAVRSLVRFIVTRCRSPRLMPMLQPSEVRSSPRAICPRGPACASWTCSRGGYCHILPFGGTGVPSVAAFTRFRSLWEQGPCIGLTWASSWVATSPVYIGPCIGPCIERRLCPQRVAAAHALLQSRVVAARRECRCRSRPFPWPTSARCWVFRSKCLS